MGTTELPNRKFLVWSLALYQHSLILLFWLKYFVFPSAYKANDGTAPYYKTTADSFLPLSNKHCKKYGRSWSKKNTPTTPKTTNPNHPYASNHPHSPLMILELYPLPQQLQELLESWTCLLVREQLLLGGLAEALVQNAELEVGHEDVLVVCRDQLWSSRTRDGDVAVDVQLLVQQLRAEATRQLLRVLCLCFLKNNNSVFFK